MRVHLDYHLGKFAEALELSKRVLADVRARPPENGLINWLGLTAASYCALGNFEDALGLYFEMSGAAKKLGFKRNQVQAATDIMATLYDLGRLQEGVELGEAALTLGEFDVTFPLRYHLALAYLEQKRFRDALKQSEAIFAGDSSVNIRSHTYGLLAELHAELKQASQVIKALESGLDLVEPLDHRDARAVMTVAAFKFGRPEQIDRAKPLAEQLSGEDLPAYLKDDFDQFVRGVLS